MSEKRKSLGIVVGNTAGRPYLIEEAAELGIGYVRLTINWNLIERRPNQYEWWIAEDIRRALYVGLKVYATIHGTPDWATESRDPRVPPPLTRWHDFVRMCVQRFPGVSIWGIWNEPDTNKFWLGSRLQYQQLVRVASDPIRDAGALVAAPECSTSLFTSPWYVWKVLQAVGDYIDIVSVHHYASPWVTALYIRILNWLGADPVWLTEVARSRNQTEEEQAAHLKEILEKQKANEKWRVSMPYVWESDDRPYVIRGRQAEDVIREFPNGS